MHGKPAIPSHQPSSGTNEDSTSTSKDAQASMSIPADSSAGGDKPEVELLSESDHPNQSPTGINDNSLDKLGSPPRVVESSTVAKVGTDGNSADTAKRTTEDQHRAVNEEKSGRASLSEPTVLTPRADGLNLVLAEVRKKSISKHTGFFLIY